MCRLLVMLIQNGYWLSNRKKIWPRISSNHKKLGMCAFFCTTVDLLRPV